MAIELSTTEKNYIKAVLQLSAESDQEVFDLAEKIAQDLADIDGCLSMVQQQLIALNVGAKAERELFALLSAVEVFRLSADAAARKIATGFAGPELPVRSHG